MTYSNRTGDSRAYGLSQLRGLVEANIQLHLHVPPGGIYWAATVLAKSATMAAVKSLVNIPLEWSSKLQRLNFKGLEPLARQAERALRDCRFDTDLDSRASNPMSRPRQTSVRRTFDYSELSAENVEPSSTF